MCVLGITKYSKLGKALLSNFDIPTKFSHQIFKRDVASFFYVNEKCPSSLDWS